MTSRQAMWVVGGGTGIGRATAIAAAAAGFRVAVSGRRVGPLDETVASVVASGGEAISVPVDVADGSAVREAFDVVRDRVGAPSVVVCAAGLNVPRREWANQSMAEFAQLIDVNLTAVARIIDRVLPSMREQGGGTIVIVSSYAAWGNAAVAGVAYTASKLGLAGLSATVNAQEWPHGIRASLVCPGDVDTELLKNRPQPPSAEQRATMLTAADVAAAIQHIVQSPRHVRIDELVISPANQPV